MKYNNYIIIKNLDFKIKFIFIFILFLSVFKIVVITGGTQNVYPHLIYIPILVASLFFNFRGAFLGGITGGILMGIIPLNTFTNENQNLTLAIIRIEIFNIIGQSKSSLVLKSISQYLQKLTLEFQAKIYNSYSLRFEFLLDISNENDLNIFLKEFKNYIDTFPIIINGKSIYLKTHLGVSILDKNKSSDKVINEAYQALDFAHESSSDYFVFNQNLNNNLATTFLLSQIEDAIENNDFYLEYQAKLNLKKNKIQEVEALVRWKHPSLGVIPPNEFIPKLEKTDSINKLTNWVIKKALEDIVCFEKEGIFLNVSVNVSPRDLAKDNFIANLFKELTKHNLTSNRINLEITETDLIKDMSLVVKNLNLLKLRGVKISMDDFGSGYSSLSYISLLPLDYIKIDKSLIRNIFKNKKNRDLLKNTIEMLHTLKKIVVAEGIEDLETLEYLKELNCELVQGFYISKPISRKDFEIFIKKSPFI